MKSTLASCVFAMLIFGVGFAATAAETDVAVSVDGSVLTRTQRIAISRTGVEILQDIGAASEAIAQRKLFESKKETWRAVTLTEQMRYQSPTARAGDLFKAALRNLRETGSLNAEADLQPIYKELDTAVYVHEDDIREYLSRAEKASKGRDVEEIEELVINAAASVGYMEVDLSINALAHALMRAHHALWRKDYGRAAAHLRVARDQVHVIVGHASINVEEGSISAVELKEP